MKDMYIKIKELADKYRSNLKNKLENRIEEMQNDDNSHYLIYKVLGISEKEGELIDIYQNKGRFLYKYAGSFLEEAAFLCFKSKFPSAKKEKIDNTISIRPKTFEDSRLIADSIKEKKVVTFSLEFLEFEVGQRVIDFVSGAAYAMDAHLSKVTDKVLTSIPNGVGYEDIDTSLEEERKRNSDLL